MRNWKFVIEYKGSLLKVVVETKYYADPYREVEKEYPGCVIKNIAEIGI